MTVLTKAQAKLLAAIALDDDGIETASASRRTIDALLGHALVERCQDPELVNRIVATARGREALRAQPEQRSGETKITTVVAMMSQPGGATLADLQAATGWQAHSVRGAIAGKIKKARGHTVGVSKVDGQRRYHIAPATS
jgi:hypothetical protein